MVAERVHSRVPVAAVKCGTESERIDMTDVIAKPLRAGLARRNSAPMFLAAKKPARDFPVITLDLPVTPENRSRLHALRQAEMKAWNATTESGFDTGHFERRQVVEKERRDLRAFGLVALMAIGTVMIVLFKSSEQWGALVQFVRQLLG